MLVSGLDVAILDALVMATIEPAIAKLVGQGMERPNADRELPLDLHYQKLVDWMV